MLHLLAHNTLYESIPALNALDNLLYSNLDYLNTPTGATPSACLEVIDSANIVAQWHNTSTSLESQAHSRLLTSMSLISFIDGFSLPLPLASAGVGGVARRQVSSFLSRGREKTLILSV